VGIKFCLFNWLITVQCEFLCQSQSEWEFSKRKTGNEKPILFFYTYKGLIRLANFILDWSYITIKQFTGHSFFYYRRATYLEMINVFGYLQLVATYARYHQFFLALWTYLHSFRGHVQHVIASIHVCVCWGGCMETEFVQNEEMICVVCDRLLGGGGVGICWEIPKVMLSYIRNDDIIKYSCSSCYVLEIHVLGSNLSDYISYEVLKY
jgi:hypothetical protein